MLKEKDSDKYMQEIILLFENEYKKDRARVTSSGCIRLDSPDAFGEYYRKTNALKNTNPKLHKDTLEFIRVMYS